MNYEEKLQLYDMYNEIFLFQFAFTFLVKSRSKSGLKFSFSRSTDQKLYILDTLLKQFFKIVKGVSHHQ